jgi:hypothetical protein
MKRKRRKDSAVVKTLRGHVHELRYQIIALAELLLSFETATPPTVSLVDEERKKLKTFIHNASQRLDKRRSPFE